MAAAEFSIAEVLERHENDESANAHAAVPKPKAAWHHQSECVAEEGIGRWEVENAVRERDRGHGEELERDDGEGGSGRDSTTIHHQMATTGGIRRSCGTLQQSAEFCEPQDRVPKRKAQALLARVSKDGGDGVVGQSDGKKEKTDEGR
ncbi:hypothetical protein CYMTET_17023 [Cymbomonas tetramitiformis]|uniref:Uncharacterized protein n=1 Tax=Cymbomonas tetramitiformis TaxID=36881 RepID=A0AAE0GAX5_9CHLO|nr:hypothetical protein CYMTET_17023 [Cymbomonas tetramitiformis]